MKGSIAWKNNWVIEYKHCRSFNPIRLFVAVSSWYLDNNITISEGLLLIASGLITGVSGLELFITCVEVDNDEE